jgi:hypothetical protein
MHLGVVTSLIVGFGPSNANPLTDCDKYKWPPSWRCKISSGANTAAAWPLSESRFADLFSWGNNLRDGHPLMECHGSDPEGKAESVECWTFPWGGGVYREVDEE